MKYGIVACVLHRFLSHSCNQKSPITVYIQYKLLLAVSAVLRTGPVYPFFVKLFNMCFKYGITPSAWQKGIINPIPKSGDKDPRMSLNYRGITLTCHMYKIYCTILKFRLTKFLKIITF